MNLRAVSAYRLQEPEEPFDSRGRSLEYEGSTGYLPFVDCHGCGRSVSSIHRLRVDFPPRKARLPPLGARTTWAKFHELARSFRAATQLHPETNIQPGMSVGLLRVKCLGRPIPDFEWPVLYSVVVSEQVIDVIRRTGLTGWEAANVVITNPRRCASHVEMYELVVLGSAGIPNFEKPLRFISQCQVCGRIEYEKHDFEDFSIDPQQWDGTDFFRFSPPFHGHIMISEKAAQLFRDSDLTNYQLTSIDEVVDSDAEMRRFLAGQELRGKFKA